MIRPLSIASLAVALTVATPSLAQHAGHGGHGAPTPPPAAHAAPAQPYAGQQARDVTSLSEADVKELLAGGGWGLAKPAELNGYPGPAHVLELADKLELTPAQKKRVELSFKRMQARARSIGGRYVAAERALDQAFRSGRVEGGGLVARLRDAERLRSELRLAHLNAHLEVTPILTPEQRRRYAELRGYGSSDAHHGHHKH